jgi:hypothetical protein
LRTELYLRIALHLIQQQDPERLRRALENVDVTRLDPGSVSVAEYHHASAYLAACARDVAAWSAHYERARDVYVAMRAFPFVRYSFADQAWQAISLGLLPLAQNLVTRAAEASSESASTVNDVPLTLAYASFCAGRFPEARGALGRAISSQLLSCRWVVALVNAELALASGDDDLLRETLDPELIAELARQETFGFIRLSATFAAGYVRLGRRAEARTMLEGAAARIHSTLDLVPAMLTIAELAPDLARPLRPLLAASVGGDAYAAAALDLMDAELARSDGAAADAERLGVAACAAFESLGWPIAAARAAIVAGRPGEALAIYRAGCGRGSRGRPDRAGARARATDRSRQEQPRRGRHHGRLRKDDREVPHLDVCQALAYLADAAGAARPLGPGRRTARPGPLTTAHPIKDFWVRADSGRARSTRSVLDFGRAAEFRFGRDRGYAPLLRGGIT